MSEKWLNAYGLLATINFAVVLAGYEFFSALISPFVTPQHTQWLTVPFRGACLALSLIVLFCGWKDKPRSFKWTPATILLVAYWAVLIFRLIVDFYFSPEFHIDSASKNRTMLFILGVTLPQILSVTLSWKIIDYKLLFKICLWLVIATIALNMSFNTKIFDLSYIYRIDGGPALYTIKFGYLGVTLSLMAAWLLMSRQWNKPVAWLLIIVGLFVMLRSGSRGPLVATFAVFILLFACRYKKIKTSLIIFAGAIALLTLLHKGILYMVNAVSPAMYQRIFDPVIQANRNDVYLTALRTILDNPFGKHFTEYRYYSSSGLYSVYWSHNTVLDAGIVAGWLGMAVMVYFNYVMLKNFRSHVLAKSEYVWLMSLILLQFFIYLFSFAFWQNSTISIGIVLSALLPVASKEVEVRNAKPDSIETNKQ